MIPLDVVSGGFDMVCNDRRVVIFNEGLEVFSFSIMKSSFCFTDVEIKIMFYIGKTKLPLFVFYF